LVVSPLLGIGVILLAAGAAHRVPSGARVALEVTVCLIALAGATLLRFVFARVRRPVLRKPARGKEPLAQDWVAAIFESSVDGIILKTRGGVITHWNPGAERLYGYRKEEVVGKHISFLVPPEGHDEFADLLCKVARGERVRAYETVRCRKNGERVVVSLQVSPIRGEGGTVAGVCTIARDLTEDRRSDEKLASALRELNEVVETIPGLFYVMDLENRLVRWNRGLEQVLGRNAEEIRGRLALEFIVPEDREAIAAGIRRAYEEGTAEAECRVIGCDGITPPYRFSAVVLHDGAGHVVGLTGVGRSVATERALEHSLREQTQIAETINRVGQVLVAELDLRKLVQEVTDAATHLSGAQFGVFFAHQSEGGQDCYKPYAFSRLSPESWERFPLPRATALFEPIYRGAGPRRIDDVTKDPSFGRNAPFHGMPAGHPPVASFLAVPVISGTSSVLGAIFLGHPEPGAFTDRAEQLIVGMAAQAAIALDNARLVADLRESRNELEIAYDATIEGWARALDLRDHDTEGHSRRVTELSVRLARALGLCGRDLIALKRGALLHDIGKMAIPDRILHKPGPLANDEIIEMRKHPTYAHAMLAQIPFLGQALDIPYCHHEAWDGTGYPRGLKGEQIPLIARIFAVVDVYDALSSNRPYRGAWPDERIRRHLQQLAGTQLDPTVVPVFLQLLDNDTFSHEADTTLTGVHPPQAGLWESGRRSADTAGRTSDTALDAQIAMQRAFRDGDGWPRILIENISDLLMIIEVDGTIRWVGPSAVNVIGFRPDELAGKTIFSITHPDDLEASRAAFAEFLRNPSGAQRFSPRALHKDGSYRCLESISTNLLDHPSFRGLLVSARDVTQRVHIEEALRQSEQRLLETIQRVGETVFEWDPHTNECHVWENPSGKAHMGHLPGDCANYYEWWCGRIHPDDRGPVISSIQAALEGESTAWSHEYRLRLNDSSYGWMYTTATIVREPSGRALRMTGSMIDITRRKEVEEALRLSEERLHTIVCAIDDVVWDWDLTTGRMEMWWDEESARRIGLEFVKVAGLDWWLCKVHPDERPGLENQIQTALAGSAMEWQGEYRVLRTSGDYEWVHTRARAARDESGRAVRVVGSTSDIRDRKSLETKLEGELSRAKALNEELEGKRQELAAANLRLAEMAQTDALTGLKNRHGLYQAFDEILARTERCAEPLSVVMLDVDHFKAYNDSFGHLAGDEVLRELAELLRASLRPYDVAARYGGEEFVVILSRTDSAGARTAAERLRAAVAARDWPMRPITISLGVASVARSGSSSEDLLDAADRAMYCSKRRGRNCVTRVEDLVHLAEKAEA
jgi:diguanylate cyclase (GGDEF)-like protein/PAS domain S-box-containing protein/putative nucleotidyltransferase with HDIG domain